MVPYTTIFAVALALGPAGQALAGSTSAAASWLSFLIGAAAPVAVDDATRVLGARAENGALHLVVEVDREAYAGRDAGWGAARLAQRVCAHDRLGPFVEQGGVVAPSVVDRNGAPLMSTRVEACGG